MYDLNQIQKDFPILAQTMYDGQKLVYLDNAATTQKPYEVLKAIQEHYAYDNANVHRGAHYLSNRSTQRFEWAREVVRDFLNAGCTEEIVFTHGTTESINMVASGLPETWFRAGDAIVVTEMEHHSNLVPWQMLCKRLGLELRILHFCDDGMLHLDELDSLMDEHVRFVSFCHVSNVLGTVNPIEKIIKRAHDVGAYVLVDGTQAIQHIPIDVRTLDCDFYCFSGHKVYGPNGIGVLYGRKEVLSQLNPIYFGGEMVDEVSLQDTTFGKLPYRLEAGTPNYPGAIAMAIALQYITKIGICEIGHHEAALMDYAQDQLSQICGIQIYGSPEKRIGSVSFNLKGIDCYDLACMLDKMGIAVRAGSHCAQPVMAHYGVSGMARASFAMYSSEAEIDTLCCGIQRISKIFSRR
ncbi:MAG: SufS family cysteine desulfurase [Clostridia bacterium]|nr:SufS family cysteine desulfurase [Clostridia bacterium]